MQEIIKNAIERGQKALSEYDSKRLVETAGVLITNEGLANSKDEAVKISRKIGYPVVMKGCSHELTHKTEMGMVKLGINSDDEVQKAYQEMMDKGIKLDGILIQEMIKGEREFVIGLIRDPQFGPCVMFGLGGIFTEVLKDVSFRIAPITDFDAEEMIEEIKTRKLLDECAYNTRRFPN